jgi:putative copper export protein
MLVVKVILVGLLIFMMVNLAFAMRVMLKGENKEKMSKFIGRRVLTSAIIVILILIAIATGVITPNPRPY